MSSVEEIDSAALDVVTMKINRTKRNPTTELNQNQFPVIVPHADELKSNVAPYVFQKQKPHLIAVDLFV